MAKLDRISEKVVADLPSPAPDRPHELHYASGLTLQGKEAPAGFAVRITVKSKTFVWFHRVDGKPHVETIGQWNPKAGGLTVFDAIVKCIDRKKAIAKGVDRKGNDVDPRPDRTRRKAEKAKPKSGDIGGLLDKFIVETRTEGNMRSLDLVEATFKRLVKPEIGNIGIYDIRRGAIVDMLDKIAKNNGPVMSDRVLAYVRSVFNWYAPKDEKFNSPIVKRMAKTKPKERARKRTLDDDEIRDLWAALGTIKDVPDCYPAYVKTLLLTATRRNEAAGMHERELDADGLWTIPAARYKTKLDHVVPLSPTVRELIGTPTGFVFSSTEGEVEFSGFSKAKIALDKEIAEIRKKAGRPPMKNWTLHDLRRTARTLMSRAKVNADHAERCLGHVIGGSRETYDRFAYAAEKRAAFEALAAMVDAILHPESNVIALRR